MPERELSAKIFVQQFQGVVEVGGGSERRVSKTVQIMGLTVRKLYRGKGLKLLRKKKVFQKASKCVGYLYKKSFAVRV